MASSSLAGLPAELVVADLAAGTVHLDLDEDLYPLEAVYGAAHVFLERCLVHLDRPAPQRLRVTLSSKSGDPAPLRALAGELANELLSCAFRHRITVENRATLEAVSMQAIAGAMGPPSLDDLTLDDPLGIAVSWEEKYRKKDKTDE